ncbi:unnamed protein product [Blepharisma stoltei]|uniref:FYVE-type domain-containing protein n=1 Tax=Blepharisma stoltei TaxID=1481888 RepID=A0AAU9K1N2_9CILI|nr:unnamed protein product [Blepharisma stoltei]
MSFRNPKYTRSVSQEGSFNSSKSSISSSINSNSSIFGQLPRGLKGENVEWKKAKECYICQKKFNHTTRRRHHCRFCGNSICEEHGIKRRTKDEQKRLRICDNCDRELIRNEIQSEIEGEISRLQTEVQNARELNEKLYKDHYEKTSRVGQLEMELSKAERSQKQKEQLLQDRLNDEQIKAEKTRKAIEDIRNELDNAGKSETDMNQKCAEAEAQLESLKGEAENLRNRKNDLETQIMTLTSKLKESYPLDHVRPIVCDRCLNKLNQVYRPMLSNGQVAIESTNDSKQSVNNSQVLNPDN